MSVLPGLYMMVPTHTHTNTHAHAQTLKHLSLSLLGHKVHQKFQSILSFLRQFLNKFAHQSQFLSSPVSVF